MSIRIIKAGFYSTLQDTGRPGFQSEGVPVCGAMDVDALKYANMLTGNDENSCCIEITLHGAQLACDEDMLIALTGGGSRAFVNESEIPFGKAIHIQKGSVLKFSASPDSCRTYFAVGGGFVLEKTMNSSSTYVAAGFGGLNGKPLQTGDELMIGKNESLLTKAITASLPFKQQSFSIASWGLSLARAIAQRSIRIFEGPEWNWISETSRESFDHFYFTILPSSNRMGLRLQSEKICRVDSKELLSTSVSKGTIQCTPDGNTILLMADCQTTGGYPRIGQVAAVDLSYCAQLRAGDRIQFTRISFAEAERLFLERQQLIGDIKRGIAARFNL